MTATHMPLVGAVMLIAGVLGLVDADPAHASGTCRGFTVTIFGTEGPDHIRGTNGPDVINGLGGDDIIEGLGGDDVLCGDSGDDILDGGSGNNICDGGPGRDRARNCQTTYNVP